MVQDICLIIIAASLAIIVIYHIPALVQFRRMAREVEKTLETARTHIVPLSHDLTVLSQEIKGIVESVRRQIDTIEEGVHAFRGTAVRLRDFEEEILQKIEKPVIELSALASTLIQGSGIFVRLLRLFK